MNSASSAFFKNTQDQKKSAKIKIYILTRAELLCPLCYEIPCSIYQALYVPSHINKNFYAYHFIEWIDGLLSSMQMLRNIPKTKVGNLLTNTSNSFTNFASTNLPIIFYKNESCYLPLQYLRVNKLTQFCKKFVYSLLLTESS